MTMFHYNQKYESVPTTPAGTPHTWSPTSTRSKISTWSLTRRRIALFACGVLVFFFLYSLHSSYAGHPVRPRAQCYRIFPTDKSVQPHRQDYLTNPVTYNATFTPHAAFQPPESLPHRYSDTIDTFSSYKYRNTCNISSLDLHAPFAPLCPDRESMVTAMSSGGRIGNDAPYMPRGCDMRWFSTEEICEILARFEKVIIVGDSMMRHVIGSINVMIRKDLGYGAVTDWNFSPEER